MFVVLFGLISDPMREIGLQNLMPRKPDPYLHLQLVPDLINLNFISRCLSLSRTPFCSGAHEFCFAVPASASAIESHGFRNVLSLTSNFVCREF